MVKNRKEYQKKYRETHKEERKKYQKKYRVNKKEEKKEYQKGYRKNHLKESKKYKKEYDENHREEIKKYSKEYDENHREEIKGYRENHKKETKEYRENHKEERKKYDKEYKKNRRKIDINYKLACNLRSRLYYAIKGNWKVGSAVRDLGCIIPELKIYLEKQFKQGMTWDNWGTYGWHIDHVKPLSSFNLSNREELLKAVHYTNLQPLWAEENIKKHNNYNEI